MERQEKIDMLEYVKNVKDHLDSVYITGLLNDGSFLQKLGMNDLSQEIYSKFIPKAVMLSVNRAMNSLGNDSEMSIDNLSSFWHEIGHEAKKGAVFTANYSREIVDEKFISAALKFCAEVNILTRSFSNASYLFKKLGNNEKFEQYKKLDEELGDDYDSVDKYWPDHLPEIYEGIHKAYSEFIEAVKDTEEFNVDLEQVYKDVLQRVDEELAKPE